MGSPVRRHGRTRSGTGSEKPTVGNNAIPSSAYAGYRNSSAGGTLVGTGRHRLEADATTTAVFIASSKVSAACGLLAPTGHHPGSSRCEPRPPRYETRSSRPSSGAGPDNRWTGPTTVAGVGIDWWWYAETLIDDGRKMWPERTAADRWGPRSLLFVPRRRRVMDLFVGPRPLVTMSTELPTRPPDSEYLDHVQGCNDYECGPDVLV
jgi:hypothetical protein